MNSNYFEITITIMTGVLTGLLTTMFTQQQIKLIVIIIPLTLALSGLIHMNNK